MAERSIHIDRLRVRVPGATADAAVRLGDGLGDAVLTRVAGDLANAPAGGVSIQRLDVKVGAGAGALEVRVADAVAGAIGERMPRGGRP